MAFPKVRLDPAVRGSSKQASQFLHLHRHLIHACILLALTLTMASLFAPAVAAASRVGVAAAVNPSVTGAEPGAAPHVIQVGVDMQADERVVTTTTGQTQLLFLDGSALTIGPSSEVTIDKFVFDPASGNGALMMRAAKGVFRLVGGKISKATPVQLTTPSATIGIRGGIAMVTVTPGQPLLAQFLYGHEMTVTAGGMVQTATSAGSAIVVPVAEAGLAPTPLPPRPTSKIELLDVLAQFQNQNFATSALSEPAAATSLPASASSGALGGGDTAAQIGNAATASSFAAAPASPASDPISVRLLRSRGSGQF
jgi:hypothetical protein